MRAFKLLLPLALMVSVLAGCASKAPMPDCQQLPADQCWQLEAKLGYRSPEKNGSGFVRWQQLGDYSDIYVSGPMGAGASTITISPDGAVLTRSGEAPIVAASGQELFHEVLNFQVPASELRAWLQGQPGPGKIYREKRNQVGQLIELEQAGWALNFSRFNGQQTDAAPNKIIANKPPYRLTVIVKSRK